VVVLELLPLDVQSEVRDLAHHSHTDICDALGRTALHWAAIRGNPNSVQILLLVGANQHIIDVEGRIAFHFAVISGHVECANVLLQFGAKIRLRDERSESDVLVSAWAYENASMVKLLVAAGADVMTRNSNNVTPLQSSSGLNYPGNVATILNLGTEPNASDKNGDTPLFEAIYYDCTEVIEILIKQDINYTHYNKAGWTILHVLALYGTVDTMNRVTPYVKGVDALWQDSRGRTAADALEDRLEANEKFCTDFRAYLVSFDDTRDDDSIESFASAVEM
jgi:ankyrin repeat protein